MNGNTFGGLDTSGGTNTGYNGFFGGRSYFNATQPLLDTFDFNGDGIGPTDGTYGSCCQNIFGVECRKWY